MSCQVVEWLMWRVLVAFPASQFCQLRMVGEGLKIRIMREGVSPFNYSLLEKDIQSVFPALPINFPKFFSISSFFLSWRKRFR